MYLQNVKRKLPSTPNPVKHFKDKSKTKAFSDK